MSARRAPGRVILTYGRSLMALVIARSLAERGVEVIGCDDVALTVLSFSKHVQETFTVAPWETEPERFLQDLEEAVREYAPRDKRPYVLMPVFREVELIARHRARFEPAIKLAAPAIASIELVTPKDRLAELARSAKLESPKTWRPVDAGALRKLASKLPYPVIVKPTDGAGGRGVSCATTAGEVEEQAMSLGFDPPPLIQECIEGEDYCVPVLARAGEITAIMAYRNLTTFPRDAGAGAVRETVDAAPFTATVEKLVAETQWDGVAQLDFRWSGKQADSPTLIEVNARFWAGLFHSMESGVDFPWLLYRQTLGEDMAQEDEPDIGAVTKTSTAWLLAAIDDIASSDPHFNAAADAWRRAKRRIKSGHLIAAIENAGKAVGKTLSVGAAIEQLRDTLRELKDAPSEMTEAKDPLVGLGVLFVLSSLVRHGRLPPEVTYKAEEAEVSAPPPPRKRPVIGVTKPEKGDLLPWWAMKFAVWLAGGEPTKVTARAPRDPHSIDGLIFGGGSDVYPKRFQGEPKPGYRYDLARGDMEASWAIAARRHDLPVLGVCRGAQMLNVLAGGTLHMDLDEFGEGAHSPKSAWGRLTHRKATRIRKQSKLASITKCPAAMRINAIHDQAIDRVGAGLVVSAREPNGVVQAVEDPDRAFWIGVQFHPELLIYRAPFRHLFKALVAEARLRAEERRAEKVEALENTSE